MTILHFMKWPWNFPKTTSYYFWSLSDNWKERKISSAWSPIVYIRVFIWLSWLLACNPDACLKCSNRWIHCGQLSGCENVNVPGGVILNDAISILEFFSTQLSHFCHHVAHTGSRNKISNHAYVIIMIHTRIQPTTTIYYTALMWFVRHYIYSLTNQFLCIFNISLWENTSSSTSVYISFNESQHCLYWHLSWHMQVNRLNCKRRSLNYGEI